MIYHFVLVVIAALLAGFMEGARQMANECGRSLKHWPPLIFCWAFLAGCIGSFCLVHEVF
jgi:hypothetical protein